MAVFNPIDEAGVLFKYNGEIFLSDSNNGAVCVYSDKTYNIGDFLDLDDVPTGSVQPLEDDIVITLSNKPAAKKPTSIKQ